MVHLLVVACAAGLADLCLRGHFLEYLLERPDVAPVWETFVNHPFVLAMGDGTLPVESFKGYLIQDYLYLVSCVLFRLGPDTLLTRDRYTSPEPTHSHRTRLVH